MSEHDVRLTKAIMLGYTFHRTGNLVEVHSPSGGAGVFVVIESADWDLVVDAVLCHAGVLDAPFETVAKHRIRKWRYYLRG